MKPEAISKDTVRSFLYLFFVLISLLLPITHGGVQARMSSDSYIDSEVFPSNINAVFENTQTAEELTGVSISSNNPNPSLAKAGDLVTLIFATNEEIVVDDVYFYSGSSAVSGAVNVVENHPNTWKATYTVDASDTDGIVSFEISYNVVGGSAGNTVTTGNGSVTVDTSPPSISSIITSWESILNAAESNANDNNVIITTSEDLGGQVVSVRLNGVTYTGSITSNSATIPIPSSDLQLLDDGNSYTLTANVSDAAGNPADQFISPSFEVDTVLPQMSIFSGDVSNGGILNNTEISLTFSSTEQTYDFSDIDDIIVSGGSIDDFIPNPDGKTFTANFSVSNAGDGTYTIDVNSGSFTDAAGNPNSEAPQFSWTSDTTPPTMTITPNNPSNFVSTSDGMATNVQAVSFILESDEQIANFLPENITLSDGLSYSSGEGITELEAGRRYRIDVESTSQGSKSITIPINAFEDLATNQNNSSVQFSWTYDSSPPVVSSISAKNLENNAINNGSTTNDQTIVLEFITSEPITGLIGDEIKVSPQGKGTFSALQALQEDTYRISFNPTSDDTFTFFIDSNSFEDKVGNVNTDASSNFLWSYDNTAPIITVFPASQTLEKGGSFVNPTVTALDNGNDISSEIAVGGDAVDVDVPKTYTITYNVIDTAGNSATEQTHTVTVEDTIAPIITSSNEVVVNENIGTGQIIYTITANDPNSTFGIKGTDKDEFSVDPTTGELTLLANPDFETKSEYDDIIVTATDEFGNTRELPIIVTINDVDEISPEVSSAVTSTSTSIVIGFSEPIVNNSVTSSDFTISGAISNPTVSLITFSASSVTLSLTDPIAFDETVLISYVQTVGSIDDTSGNSLNDFVNQVVTNNLLDNEIPIITSPSSVAIDENIGSSQVVYTVNATDNDQISSYEITGGADASSFSIDPVSGEVRLLLDPNYENKTSYLFTVRASDPSNNLSNNFTVTVVINDLDEIPPTLVLNGDSFVTAEAGQPYTEPDPAYTVNDNNGEENVTVELQGVVNTNQIDSYDLVYTATDAAGNETTRTRTVQVADNTPPVITLTPYQETVYLNVNESYTLPVLTIDDFDENPTIVIPDAPDTSKVGVTTLIWIATDNEGQTSSKTQKVIVGQPPTITLFGENPQKINLGTAFAEPGASAVDYLGADLSESLDISYSPDDTSTDTVRSFNAHYSVTDSNGVTTNVTRRFDVVDNIIPVLSFTNPTSTSLGSAITWPVKTTYIDPGGVEASDNYDDDATLVIDKIESVDTSNLNSENFVYFDTEDSSGNNATQLVRTVQMVDQTPPSVEFENPSQSEIRVVRKGVFTQPVIVLSDNYDPSSDIILNQIISNGNGNIVPVVDTYILDTYTITYSAEDTSGNTTAAEDQITTTITIDPIVDASASSSVVCSLESVTLGSSDTNLQDANGNNYTIEWTSSPEITDQVLGGDDEHIVTAVVTQTTTFTLTLIDSDGNTFSDSSTVQVNPLPSFTVQEDAEICEGSSINLGVGIVDESAAGYAYRWESTNNGFISSAVNPSYTPISSDTVRLTVTSPAGCQESDSFEITVVEKPIITFPTGDVFDICEGDTFNITSSLFNVQNAENYSWSVLPEDSGSFETSESDPNVTIFTPNSTGQVQLTLTATDQTPCTGSKAESITLNIKPKATLSLTPQDPVVCSTEQIVVTIGGDIDDLESFTVSPNGAILNIIERKITYSPDESDGNSVEIILSADQVSPCEDEERIEAKTTIGITPKAEFQVSTSPLVVCYDDPTPINLSGTVTITDINTIAGFTWTVVDGGGNVSGGDSTNPNNNWLYYPGPGAISSGSAILQLAVIPNSPCPPSEVAPQTLVIELHQTPEIIKKADDITFCEGDDIEITSDIIEYNNISQSNFLWSTSSDEPGSFTAGTSSSAYSVYQPSQKDIDNGFVDLTITVTPNASSACELPKSRVIRFNVNKTKIVELGDPVDVCESQGYFDLVNSTITDTNDPPNPYTPTSGVSWERADNGSVDGFNSSTSLTPRFTFSQSDIDNGQVIVKMTYDDGSCNTISDTKIINIIRTPFADLGAPIDICVGDQTVLNNFTIRPVGVGNITWELLPDSGASGLTLVGDNSPTPTLNAEGTATGSYELKVTIDPVDGCGEQVVETVDVNVIEKPTVDLSLVDPDNFEVCQGDDFTFSIDDINILTEHAGGYTWSSVGNGSFDGLGNPTSSKQRPDSYTLGSEDIARGSVIFRLDVGPESPCPSGDYSSTITIPVSRNPSILGPNEVDLCKTDPLVIDLQNYFNVTDQADFTYQWSTSANGAFSPVKTGGEEALAATYTPSDFEIEQKFVVLTLVATDSNCSTSDTKSITFYFNDPPIVDAGSEEVILCEDAIDYTTEAQITIDPRVTSGYSYVWDTTGDGTFLPSRTELQPRYVPGEQDRLKRKVDDDSEGVVLTLTLVSTTACSVTVDDSVELFFEPKPEVSLPDDFEVCADKSIDLSANVNDHVDLSSYFWTTEGDGTFDDSTSPNSSNPTPTYFPGPGDILAETVEIKLNVGGENGCSSSSVEDRLTISLVPPPTAEAGPNTVVCETGGSIHQNNDASATNYSFVQWEIPAQDTNGDGLIDSNDAVGGDFGTINFGNTLIPEFIPGPDALAKLELPNEDDHYVTLQLNAYPTNYNTCNIDSGLCCGVFTDTVKVFIEKNYSVALPDQKSICEGDEFTLLPNELVIDNIPSYSLLWQAEGPGQLKNFAGNSKTPTYTPQDGQVGNVTITLTITPDNPTTCTGTDPIVETISLFIEPLPIVDAGPTEVFLCEGESYETVLANVVPADVTKYWNIETGSGSFTDGQEPPSAVSDTNLNLFYTPSQQDYQRGFAVISLNATPEGNCVGEPDVSDIITLRFNQPPTIDIKGEDDGFSTIICDTQTYTYSFANNQVIVDNGFSYKWNTLGDGEFLSSDEILLPEYRAGDLDKQNGTVDLELTVYGSGGCTETKQAIQLTIPTLDVGVDRNLDDIIDPSSSPTSVCINDTLELLAETNLDNYNISWSVDPANAGLITQGADGLTPEFRPLLTGTVRVNLTISGGDFCDDEDLTDEIVIDVTGLPEITLPQSLIDRDKKVCFEDTFDLEDTDVPGVNAFVDSVKWTDYYFTLNTDGTEAEVQEEGEPLSGLFANTTNPDFGLYTPSDKINDYEEQVYVRLTMTAYAFEPPCDTPQDDVSQSFTLTLTPTPKILNSEELWGDATVCAGDLYKPIANLSNYDSYEWSSTTSLDGEWFNQNSPEPSYRPSEDEINAGKFTLKLTVSKNGSCKDTSIEKEITVVPTPIVELSDLDVCYPTNYDPDSTGFLISPTRLENFSTVLWSAPPSEDVYTPGRFSINSDGSALNGNSLGDSNNGYRTYYYPSADDYTNGKVVITLTASPNDPCAATVSDTMELILTPEPVIDVGGPYIVCEDQDSIQLNGSVINGTILSWSSPEGFSSNDLNAIYTFTDSDKENGEVTLTLTAIGEGNCGNRSKDVTIEITKRVIVNNLDQQPFSDVDLCVVSADGGTNNYLFDEISISNYESYVWSSTTAKGELINKSDINGSFGGVFEYRPNPDNPDIGEVEFTLTVTPKDPCLGTTSYTKKLIYHEEVEINVEDPFEVCQVEGTGNSFTVSATTTNSASVQWRVVTPNSGILTDSSESIATYQPSVSDWRRGNVTLEVTAQPNLINVCGEKSETITIGLIAEPQVNIDADISANSTTDDRVICLNDQTQIHAFIDFTYDDELSHANRKTSYTWISNGFGSVGPLDPQKPTENVYYIPDPRDVDIEGGVDITLEVINYENINIDGGCGERKVTDTVTLTVLPGPSAEIDMIPTACVGDEILISASIFDEGSVQWKAYSSLDYNRTDNATAGIGTEISGNFILNESENGTDYSVRFVPNYNSISQEDIDAGIQIELGVFGQNTNDNISSPCLAYYTHKTVNFDQKPVILFGDQDEDGVLNNGEVEVTDFKICQGETLELSNIYPSVNHGINITWTSTGNGLFNGSNNSTILEPTYTPGTQDIINGQVTLTLTVDAVGACADTTLPVSKDLILYITSPPTVTVIPSFDVCLGVEDLSITVGGDNPNQIIETEFLIPGTTVTNASNVEWDHNGEGQLIVENVDGAYDLKPVYVPTQEDVGKQVSVFVKVIGENECNKENYAAEETIILNILPAPSLSAGNNTSVCVNEESYTFDNGAIAENVQNIFWSHDGTGSITDGQGTLTPTYEFGPNETGTVDFTVTADGYSPGVTNPDQNFCNFMLERSFTLTISEEPSISIKKLSNSVDGDPISTFCTNSEIYLEYEGSDFAAIDQTNWSSNGEGSFVNVSGNIWQFFPTEQDKIDVLQGGKELIVTITASGTDGCESSISDSVSIQFSPEPVAIINSGAENGTLCPDVPPDVSSFDLVGFVDNHSDFYWRIVDGSGTGSFDPGPFENQTSYIPSPEDRNDAKSVQIELVAVGFDNCGEATDTITIDIIQNPFVEIENSTVTICESADEIDFSDVTAGSLFKINGGSYDEDNVVWTSSSEGGFFVENSTDKLRPKYIITPEDISNGEVTLYVKVYGNDECGSTIDKDEIKVQFSKEPKVEYLVNNNGVEEGKYQFEICEGESFIYFEGAEFTNVTEIEWRTTSHPEISDPALQIDQQYIGTGYFDFSDIEKPRYFPSDDDFTNVDGGPGYIELLVVGSNQGACAPDAKKLKIDLIRKAIITADQTLIEVCETNNSVNINNSTTNILVQNVGTEFINGEDNILWSIVPNDNGYIGLGEIKNENSLNPTYEPSGSDKQQGVTLRLSITGQGETCGFVDTKDFEIRFIDKIEIEAGNSGTICKDERFEIVGTNYSGPSDENIRWRAFYSIPPNYPVNQPDPNDLADGTFDDFRSLTPIYTPGESDIAQGTVYLVLESTEVSHECGNSFDYLTLEIESQISVYSPPVLNVCSDYNGGRILVEGYASRINSSSWVKVDGSSTSTLGITPIPGTDNIYYDIQEDDIINGSVTLKLSATGSGNCNVNSESTTLIQIYQAINATAGETASICDGNNYEIKDSEIFSDLNDIKSIKWTVDPAAGNLLNSNSIHPTFVPNPNFTGDEVQLTLSIEPKDIPLNIYTIPEQSPTTFDAPCLEFSMTKKLIIANDLTNISTAEIVSDSGGTICSDETSVKFSISDLENALNYEWDIPNGATFENNTDKNDSVIYVSFANFDVNSTETISVIADNGCEGQSIELEKDIEIRAQPILNLTTANDVQELCYNSDLSEIVYELSGGAVASEIEIDWALNGSWGNPGPSDFALTKTASSLTITASYSSYSDSGKIYDYRFKSPSSDCYNGDEDILDSNGNYIEGRIEFIEPPSIARDTDPSNGELVQDEICSGTEIDLITISYNADNVRIDWLDGVPDGIEYNDDGSATITIGGFPEANEGDVTSTFRYKLTPVDSQGCEGDSIEGSFEIDATSSVVASPSNPSIIATPDFCDGDLISYSFTLDPSANEIPEITFEINGSPDQEPDWINISELNADKTFTIAGYVDSSSDTTLIEFYFAEPSNACNGANPPPKKYGRFNISPIPSILIKSDLYNVDGNPGLDSSGPKTQIICDGEDLDDIILEVKPAGSFVNDSNLPIGVNLTKVDVASSTTVADVYIISGSPNNSNNTEYIFNYTIEAETTSGCRTEFTGTITRNVEHTLIPNGSFSTDPPAICEGSAIEQISYTYSSGADGVLDPKWYEVDELGNETQVAKPNGILVDKGTSSNPIVTISGTPTLPPNSDKKIYKYEIETTSSTDCGSGTVQIAKADGRITINPVPYFERQNNFATESFCEGTDVSIVFKTDQNVLINEPDWSQYIEGNNIDFDSPVTDPIDGKLVWNLTGTVNGVSSDVNLNYTLEAVSTTTLCSSVISGTIIINNKHDLDLIQGNDKQTICEGSEIQDILYRFGGAANSVEFKTPLLSGLNYEFIKANENDDKESILRIYGSPSEQVPINDANIVRTFTIETSPNTGNCGTEETTIDITILPKPQFISSQTSVVVCEGQLMQDMVFSMINNTEDISFTFQWTDDTPIGIFPVPDANGSPPTFTLSGTPDGVDDDKLYPFTLQAAGVGSNSCVSEIIEGSILVQNSHEIGLTINSGSAIQEICAGDEINPIVIEWGGGVSNININNLPPGLNPIVDPNGENKITISGAPVGNGGVDLDFSVVTQNNTDSCDFKTLPIKISVVKQPTISVNFNSPGTRIQTGLCEGDDIEDIDFEVENGVTDADIIWTPQRPGTVYLDLSDINNGNISLKGKIDDINPDIEYEYEIFAINNDKGCVSSPIKGSLQADQKHELDLISTFITTSQNICYQEEIEEIVYTFGGGADSARVDGLPRGIDYRIENDRLIIFGSLEQQVENTSTNQYTVITSGKSGNECPEEKEYGDFTLVPDPVINLETPFSSVNQYVCEGIAIDDIIYTFAGEATDYVVSGLPPGLDLTEIRDTLGGNNFVKKLTISGVPNINISDDKLYEFTVKALGDNNCDKDIFEIGEITVKANAELTLISLSDSDKQVVCVGEEIEPIRIKYENSNIPVVRNMPNGLKTSVDLSTNIFTIQGNVDEGSSYAFSVYGINANGCESLDVPITLDVQPSFSILPTQVVENPNDINNTGGASYVKNITCYGNEDGEIRVNLQGGSATTNYIFVWDGPNNYVNTTQLNHIENLSPGTYNVTVAAQGARNCSISETFIITEPQPLTISTNEIRPVSCTGSEDGLISVTIAGGNQDFYRNFIWEVLQEDVSCTTYTVRLRDNDNDRIFDIVDADIDNDGSTDPGKTDVNNDGMIDEANDPNFSFGTVSYQSCDGVFIQNNILRGEFSANGIYQVCAIPNTISSAANLDHDLDSTTDDIASVSISGGTSSCSSAETWTRIDRLKGSSLASNLIEGIYRLTVIEGPDLNDIESNDLESLRNDPNICTSERIFELPKDQILYGSVRVDETYCSLSGGYIDIDVNQSAGSIYFYYDGVRVPNTDVEVIAAEFGINTYRVLIQNPNSNGSFEIRNATGCGVVVAQDLLDTNVITPIISYTSPELEKYGTISERSNILFTLAGNPSYYRVEWYFGDASPVAVGDRVSHQYFAEGTYTVTVYVYNASGCFTTASEEIVVGKGYTILMPNAFSPNGDNINEIIGPLFTGLKAVEFYIYNSQGILIYQEFVSEDNLSPNGTIEIMGWDGENSDPSSNFYIYKIIGTRINEELVTRTGTIFLIE